MDYTDLLIEGVLYEMAYPAQFSFDKLKSLTSFAAKQKYCEQYLKKIGAGSSRIAYQVDDEKVLKLAKNSKGIAQNEQEIQVGSYDLDIFAKTFDYDKDNSWVEMELARKPKPTELKRIFGVDINMFASLIYALGVIHGCLRADYINKSRASAGNAFIEKWAEDDNGYFMGDWIKESGMTEAGWDFFSGISQWMYYYGPEEAEISDLPRLANLGIVKRDGKETIVIIDFGLSKDVYQTYYKR